MTHRVILPYSNERVFRVGIRGMSNILYVLRSEVEEWLNASGSAWEFVGGRNLIQAWPLVGLQIWQVHWDMVEFCAVEIPPAEITIEDPDVMMMFKLTFL